MTETGLQIGQRGQALCDQTIRAQVADAAPFGVRIAHRVAYSLGGKKQVNPARDQGRILNMAHPRSSAEGIVRRGKTLYEQRLRPQVEWGNAGALLYAMRIDSSDFGRLGARSPWKAA